MFNIVVYSILWVVLLYCVVAAYIKIKLRFWRTQPVFHIYNLFYWISPPGVISLDNTDNKYINHRNIKTQALEKINDTLLLDQVCNFIKNYYIAYNFADIAEYKPTKNNIVGFLDGVNHPSYFTVYQKPHFLLEGGEVTTSLETIQGVITGRVINICFKGKKPLPVYYVDNLCVHPDVRKQGIAPELIQTHYANMRRYNSKIAACLFKREGEMTAIVPLTTYTTYGFTIANMSFPADTTLHASMKVVELGLSQLTLIVEFIKEQKNHFECVILPDVSNLANMIKTENIIVYGLITNGVVLSIYIFRNIQLYYNGQRAVECILTLYSYNKEMFISGFNIALGKIKEKLNVGVVLLEDYGQTYGIIDNFQQLGVPELFRSPTAFFLYNYACYGVKNRKFMILY